MGEALFWASATLFSEAGAHILFVFLLLAGVLLLTGASIAGVAAGHARERPPRRRERGAAPTSDRCATAPLPGRPDPGRRSSRPSPRTSEPVVRATHVEAPALDASERYPDLYGEPDEEPEPEDEEDEPWEEPEPEPLPQPDSAGEPEQEELTPMGNRRSAVTEADDSTTACPSRPS